MFGLGFWELAIILVVAFLVLGPKKLPDLARSLGKGLRDLRRASEDLRSSIQEPLDEIRKPLEEIRSDLADTVYQVQDQIEREAREEALPPLSGAALTAAPPGGVNPPGPPVEGEGDPKEIEDRRREVEELYAHAAEEDAVGDGTTRPALPAPDPDPGTDAAAEAPEAKPEKPLAG